MVHKWIQFVGIRFKKIQYILFLSKWRCSGLYLFSLLLSKFELILRWGGLSFSCPGRDLMWCQYPEFVTAILKTGQFA
jgi:hypothetical protein